MCLIALMLAIKNILLMLVGFEMPCNLKIIAVKAEGLNSFEKYLRFFVNNVPSPIHVRCQTP